MSSESVFMRLVSTRSRIEGNASVASTPAMATTTSSSMSVKPRSAGRGAMASPLPVAAGARTYAGVGQRQRAVVDLVFAGDRCRGNRVGGARHGRGYRVETVDAAGIGAAPGILHHVQAAA